MVGAAGIDPIDLDMILRAHHALLSDDPDEVSVAGRVRGVQNWIGPNDLTPGEAEHVPLPPDLLGDLLADLIVAANRTDVPAIANAAVVHAQFESIHPFTDGNGRIGRALLSTVMRRRGLTTDTVVPTAAVMLADVDRHFSVLDGYRDGDVETLVAYVAMATIVACEEAEALAGVLGDLVLEWRAAVRPRARSAADRLIEQLVGEPVTDAERVCTLADVAPPNAYEAIARLEAAGVLDEVTGHLRNRVWVATDVLDELDRFEDRIGRRVPPTAHRRSRT